MNKDLIIKTGVLPEFLSGENSLQKIGDSKPGTGAKVVSGAIVAGLVVGGGWAFVKFALPAIMAIISPVIAAVASFFVVLLGIGLAKPFWKWLTAISNKLYKAAIRYNPEVAVENKLEDFDRMSEVFRKALAKITKAAAEFKELARKSEKENVDIQERLNRNKEKLIDLRKKRAALSRQVDMMKAEIDSGKRKTQKEREPYYDALHELTATEKEIDRLASNSKSDQNLFNMNNDLVKKYAAKAHIFADWESFLDRGADQIDNKKRELRVWWEAIKKEISVANAGKDATNALKFILCDRNGNEYDFNLATEYIIDKIDTDYSITKHNMEDLQRHVDGFDFNSDDAFNDLEKLLKGIESGEIETPSAIEISSPAHKFTSSERASAGVLGDIFWPNEVKLKKQLKMTNKNKNPRQLRPWVKWTLGVIGAGAVALGVYHFSPKNASSADLVGGIDNFIGWAPGVAMNDGLAVNKESRMYNEFGLALKINVIGEVPQQIAALKSGDVDFIFTTTDISPIMMEEGSDLVQIEAQQFLEIVDSRGGDVLVVDNSITTIEQLRGKKIACALGWPSNTMLDIILKAGGLTEDDVKIINYDSPTKAKDAYVSGNVDACVVWSPDNFVCLDARPSRELITTADMPNTIVDVLVAKKSTLEKKKDAFVKLAKGWLTANAEVQTQGNYEWAATSYKKAFQAEDSISDIVEGLKGFRFATYGDNLNFFGLNPEYTGITGGDIYNRMSRVYKHGYGNDLKNVVPWTKASNTSILEGVSGLDGEMHQAEGPIQFAAATDAEKTASAVMTKRVTVNFAVNSAKLEPSEKRTIRSAIGNTANQFSTMRIRVEGNTDNTGSRELNIRLSKERAQSVVDFLVSEYGFDPKRFIVIGNGPDKPVASNDTEAGRAANRRTDFEFVSAQ